MTDSEAGRAETTSDDPVAGTSRSIAACVLVS
jgi:hypothetical protein